MEVERAQIEQSLRASEQRLEELRASEANTRAAADAAEEGARVATSRREALMATLEGLHGRGTEYRKELEAARSMAGQLAAEEMIGLKHLHGMQSLLSRLEVLETGMGSAESADSTQGPRLGTDKTRLQRVTELAEALDRLRTGGEASPLTTPGLPSVLDGIRDSASCLLRAAQGAEEAAQAMERREEASALHAAMQASMDRSRVSRSLRVAAEERVESARVEHAEADAALGQLDAELSAARFEAELATEEGSSIEAAVAKERGSNNAAANERSTQLALEELVPLCPGISAVLKSLVLGHSQFNRNDAASLASDQGFKRGLSLLLSCLCGEGDVPGCPEDGRGGKRLHRPEARALGTRRRGCSVTAT